MNEDKEDKGKCSRWCDRMSAAHNERLASALLSKHMPFGSAGNSSREEAHNGLDDCMWKFLERKVLDVALRTISALDHSDVGIAFPPVLALVYRLVEFMQEAHRDHEEQGEGRLVPDDESSGNFGSVRSSRALETGEMPSCVHRTLFERTSEDLHSSKGGSTCKRAHVDSGRRRE